MSLRVPSGPPQPQGFGEDPQYYFTGVFIKFLQALFGSFEKGSYRWDENDETTEIVISMEQTVSRDVVERRPVIRVIPGGTQSANLSLDQFQSHEPTSSRRNHTDLESTSVVFNCLSKAPVEAGRLAHICRMSVRRLKRTLMRTGIHQVGENISMSGIVSPGPIIPDADGEIFMVAVQVPFYYQDFWSVEPLDKALLTSMDLAVTSAPGTTEPERVPYTSLFSPSERVSETLKARYRRLVDFS
jgi:hypothetical protein